MRALFLIFFQIYLVQCQNTSKPFSYIGKKHWGVSLAAPSNVIDHKPFEKIKSIGTSSITLMPYAFLPKNEAQIRFSYDSTKHQQWWGETPEGIRKCIDLAHSQSLEVMIKPHLWIAGGEFTGNLDFENTQKWELFERSYLAYILFFAQIAEEKHISGFCIGTELANHVKKRPEFWLKLIVEIRNIYHGKLTYAENWDKYAKVPFWNKLDFIGVDAYFPLSSKKDPDLNTIKNAWKEHAEALKYQSGKWQKPILFTEIGYRSNDNALEKPWETDYSKPINEELQARAYQAFFEQINHEPWFAGAYIWKWETGTHHMGEYKDSFTPQNKLAEKVIERNFKK